MSERVAKVWKRFEITWESEGGSIRGCVWKASLPEDWDPKKFGFEESIFPCQIFTPNVTSQIIRHLGLFSLRPMLLETQF